MREKREWGAVVGTLCLLCFAAASAHAVPVNEVLHWRLSAADTTINVGQPTVVTVSAWIENAAPGNGLDTWQTDIDVDIDNVVAIDTPGGLADLNILAPDPYAPGSGWDAASVNNPLSAEVRNVNAMVADENFGAPSTIGVDAYTDLFEFTIVGVAPGQATFTVTKDWVGGGCFGLLVDGTELDNEVFTGTVLFDADQSCNIVTVVPEPASAFTLLLLAGLAWTKRRQ